MSRVGRALAALTALAAGFAAGAASAESGAVPKPLSQEWADDPPKTEDTCETSDDRYAMAPLFRIASAKTTDRVYLLARKQACTVGGCPHRRRSYLVPGDIVLAGPEDRGFRCVYFGSRRGELIAGFVSAGNLTPVETETKLDRAFLLGPWRRDEASRLRIGPKGAVGVEVSGGGHWKGAASVNTGEFRVEAETVTSPLILKEEQDGCTVVIERRGPFLLLNDNSRCGGHNVRFVGIYIRQATR